MSSDKEQPSRQPADAETLAFAQEVFAPADVRCYHAGPRYEPVIPEFTHLKAVVEGQPGLRRWSDWFDQHG